MNTFISKSLATTTTKSLALSILMIASLFINAKANITTTAASATICTNFASAGTAPKWTALGTITIREGANPDLGGVSGSWSVVVTLAAPTGWQFNSAVAPTFAFTASKNISSISVGSVTSSAITFTINGNNKTKGDKITITNLQVQPTTTSPVVGYIRPSSVAGIAKNLTASTTFATLTPSSPVAGTAGITISSTPAGAICSGTSVAFSSSVTNGGATPAYQWKLNGTNISGATNATYSSSALANGNNIVCSVTSYSCIVTPTATSATKTMTVNAMPSAITGASSVCSGFNTTLTNTGGGTWSSSNTDVATIGASTGIVTGVAAGIVANTYTISGCSVTKVLTVNATPETINGTKSVCATTTTSLSSASSGTWGSSTTGVATVSSSTGVVSGIAAGTSNISLTASNGCYNVAVVTVNAMPTNITGTASVCVGNNTTLNNTVAGGTWASGNTAAATVGASTGIVTGIAPGTSVITYTLSGGCTKTITVTVNATPSAIIGASNLCAASTTTLTGSGGGTWSSSTTSVATVNSSTGLVSGVAQGTTTISYSLSTGCRAISVITVRTTPAAIGGATAVCSGYPTTFTNTSLYGTWGSSNAFSATVGSTTGIVTGVAQGTATISYSTGCGTTATKVVSVTNSPITGTLSVCNGYTTTLADATVGGTWASSNASVATVGSTGVVTGIANGTATISYAVGSCASTAVVTVNVAPAAITGPSAVCQGSTTTLSNATMYGSWTSGNSSIATIGSSTGIITGVAEGATVITYSTGCGTSSSTTFTVNVLPSAITGISAVCAGSSITVASSGSGTWSSSNTSVATIGSSNGVVTGVASGTASVTYMLATGCSVNGVVSVNAVPAAITGTTSICAGATTTLTNAAGGTWVSSNTSAATIGSSTGVVTGVAAGTTIISYVLPTGCASTIVMSVNALPSAITGTAVLCAGNTTSLSSTVGGTWASSITGVATVNAATGEVTGIAAGTSNISYTFSTGCKVGKQVTINALPSAIGGTATTCIGATTTLTNTGGGTWASANTSIATIGSSNGVVTGIAIGTAEITYALSTGCATTQIVTVNTIPAAGTISGASSICESDAAVLAASVEGGVWSSSDDEVADIDAESGDVFGLVEGAVTITYTVSNACGSSNVAAALAVNTFPAVNAVSGASSVCAGASVTLSNTTIGGVWGSTNTAAATVSAAGVVTGVAAGTSTISYTITNACGSIAAAQIITVNPLPVAGTITGTAAVCEGAATTLANIVAGGVWGTSNTSIATVSGGVVTGVTAGNATISYTVTNSCGTAVATQEVTVNPLPVAGTISGTMSVCSGNNTTLGASVAGGNWSSNGTTIATVNSLGEVAGLVAGTTTISYTVVNGCGTAVATAVVTVNVSPDAITGTPYVCVGTSNTLENAVAGGLWSSSNAAVVTVDASGVITGVSAGAAVITYQIAGSCPAFVTVNVNELPSSPITGATQICGAGTITLSIAAVGGTWSSQFDTVATISAAGEVNSVTIGQTVITYNVNPGCGVTTVVTVDATPGPIFGVQTACTGGTTSLGDNPTGGVWSSSTPAVAAINPATGLVNGLSAGTSTITYTLSTGCYRTISVSINPTPAAITGPSMVCAGSTITLENVEAGGTWASAVPAAATVGSATGIVTGIGGGSVNISYTAPNGCKVAKVVSLNPLPVGITGINTACEGATTTLYNYTAGGVWSSSDDSVATIGATTGVVSAIALGSNTMTYTIPATGCFRSMGVTVNPTPSIIMGNTPVCAGSTITLSNTLTGGTWLSGNAAIAPTNTITGVVTGSNVGTTTVTYKLPNTCKTTAVVTVNAVPNVISGASVVCAGGTITLANTSAGGTWVSNSTAVATIGSTGILSGLSAGTTVITYISGGACFTTKVITVNAMPAAVTGTSVSCAGMVSTLVGDLPGGTWSSNNAGIASVGATTGVYTAVAAGAAIITYKMPNGCFITRAVSVNALPATISGTKTACSGFTVALTNTTVGGAWSSSNAAVASVGTSGIVSAVVAGTADITYTLPTGCLRSATVTVNASPAAIVGASSVCASYTTTLSNSDAGGRWVSSVPAAASVGSATGVVTALGGGAVNISYTMPNGCAAVKTVSLNASPYGITGTAAVCQGANTTLANYTAGGTWSSAATAIATIGSSNGVVSGAAAGNAYITYTAPNGCFRTLVVTINQVPSAIVGSTPFCSGSTLTLGNDVTGGTWLSNSGAIAPVNTTTGIVTGGVAGSTVITYKLANGCSKTTTVTVNALPNPINGYAKMCVGNTITLAASAGTTWVSSNPATATISTTGVVAGLSAGTTTISFKNAAGCATTKQVTVNATASAGTITGLSTVALGGTVTLANLEVGGAWSSSSTAVATVNAATGVVTGVTAGSAMVTYIVNNGCGSATTTMPVAVVAPAAKVAVGSDKDETIVTEVMQSSFEATVYPNPNNGAFTVKGTTGSNANASVVLEVTDMFGKVIYQNQATVFGGNFEERVALQSIPAGIYMLVLHTGNEVKTLKFSVN